MVRFRLTRALFLAAVAAASFAVVGCTDAPAAPTATAPYSQVDLVAGTGAVAATGNSLTVNYTGWLYDATKPDFKGLQFDSSIGRTPFVFVVGVGQAIAGWDRGVVGMAVGGTRRLIIPPSLAYGDTRRGLIPPNATLVFDITLLSTGS